MKKDQKISKDISKPSVDYVVDELGRVVFTRAFHLKRGFCCGSGCIHCPYDKSRGSRRILRRDK